MKHHLSLAVIVTLIATPLVAQEISAGALASFGDRDVIVLGELHDNGFQHANQAAAVRALAPKAVVFEMLTPEKAGLITPDLLADADALGLALDWANSGWPDFSMYYPIFAASGGAAIYGGLVPRAVAREVVQSGAVAERFGPDAARFGLVGDLPGAQQAEREALQMAAHCDALPEDMLPGMVMIQRLRDATLARTVVQALEDTGGPVVVITGNGHARTDWGMPALLPEGLNVVSVAQLEAAPEGPQPHDAWIVTPPVAREDPCAAFR